MAPLAPSGSGRSPKAPSVCRWGIAVLVSDTGCYDHPPNYTNQMFDYRNANGLNVFGSFFPADKVIITFAPSQIFGSLTSGYPIWRVGQHQVYIPQVEQRYNILAGAVIDNAMLVFEVWLNH